MSRQKRPNLIQLYIKSCSIGFALSAVFALLVIWFDLAGLGKVMLGSDFGGLAIIAFWLLNGIAFAGVQFAISMMGLDGDDDDDPRGGMMMRGTLAEPIRVRDTDRKDRRNIRR